MDTVSLIGFSAAAFSVLAGILLLVAKLREDDGRIALLERELKEAKQEAREQALRADRAIDSIAMTRGLTPISREALLEERRIHDSYEQDRDKLGEMYASEVDGEGEEVSADAYL